MRSRSRARVESSLVSPPTTTTAPQPLASEEIRVTPDFIEYGDDLAVVVDKVAADDGLLYVLAFQVYAEPRPFNIFEEAAVLVAFDDGGIERWRIELDGMPTDVVVVDGDPWVLQLDQQTVSRVDAADGRILGHVTLDVANLSGWMLGAFGAVWVSVAQESVGAPPELVRIDPDLSTTSIELPSQRGGPLFGGCDSCRGVPIVGGTDGLWIPLGEDGLAMVDPITNQVTAIPRDVIGHEVWDVAVDGDVTYVASRDQVTSMVDRHVLATVSIGAITYLGRVDGVFGVLVGNQIERFQTLRANDPMRGGNRAISNEDHTYGLAAIDGEAWVETLGLDTWALHRLQLLPLPDESE